MKEVPAMIVKSLMTQDALSIRDPDGHATSLKRNLVRQGFEEGEAVVIVSRFELDLLKTEGATTIKALATAAPCTCTRFGSD